MNFLKKISICYCLPNRCRRCLSKTRTNLAICRPCVEQLPWLMPHTSDQLAIDRSWFAFRFEAPLQDYIHGLKFSNRWETASTLGELMAERLLATDFALPEALLPVPLHPSRLKQRGYNQASLIGAHLANKLNLPFHTDFLVRHKNTNAQAQLKYKNREQNLANAFSLIKPIPYQHIALVDDVYTTGSTLKSLARTIRSHSKNPIQIDAICVARAQRKIT